VLHGHEEDQGPSALALRLAGAVHRLVLEGKAPGLAPYYPSVGGIADADAAWPEFRDTVEAHADEIRRLIETPPQTNEVGRAAVLVGALLRLTSSYRMPIRLLEVGASAGLNMCVDRFAFDLGDGRVVGDVSSAVVLREPWAAPQSSWPPGNAVEIAERRGCDAHPVELTTTGELLLLSYVWPDQMVRIERLRSAFALASQMGVVVERASAIDFLSRELAGVHPGVVTVVWHSVLWQYLGKEERETLLAVLAEAGSRATPNAPLAHIAFEPVRPTPDRRYAFLASETVWPGGAEHVIAEGQGHGPPVVWR
jgi:hypothetical protein